MKTINQQLIKELMEELSCGKYKLILLKGADYINGIVNEDVEVTEEYLSQEVAMKKLDMRRLPENATETVKVIKVGNYDEYLCAGTHVKRTSEIDNF